MRVRGWPRDAAPPNLVITTDQALPILAPCDPWPPPLIPPAALVPADPPSGPTAGPVSSAVYASLVAACNAIIYQRARAREQAADGDPPHVRRQRADWQGNARPRVRSAQRRQVVLLSLFDVFGIAYHALIDLLAEHGLLDSIARAWFVELCPVLAAATAGYWDRKAAERGVPPCKRAGFDVCNLLRNGAADPRRICNEIPVGALVIIIAGSPCIDMTKFSEGDGALGLCGPYSFNCFAVPLIGWTMQNIAC